MKQFECGVVAAGHPETAKAAQLILESGGNAFDASLAALTAACVAEPILASLGGGGFLLTHTPNSNTVYDFFVQTPQRRRAESELDFYPIHADFGAATQEFHIGKGSIATPGVVKGIFAIHSELCSMPLREIVAPAIELAKSGVKINRLQAYILDVISPILNATPAAYQLYVNLTQPSRLVGEGEELTFPELAETLELLCHEGEEIFYQGDIAKQIVTDCADSGSLAMGDLADYRVIKREPLETTFCGQRILTNPLPSTGGALIAHSLALLEKESGTLDLPALVRAMAETNRWRAQGGLEALYQAHPPVQRGTTHFSVADKQGNLASLTLSNGEGSAYVIPNTGVMLNNMLGEEDLNPGGFHRWPLDQRLSSMMAPSMIFTNKGITYALGSGGSNRIRTAILQVIIHLLAHGMSLREAVESPRVHFENDLLNIEPGFCGEILAALKDGSVKTKYWPEKNLFFGGVHAVVRDESTHILQGAGDSRRGGAVR